MQAKHLGVLVVVVIGFVFANPAESVISVSWAEWHHRPPGAPGTDVGSLKLLEGKGGFTQSFHIYDIQRPLYLLRLTLTSNDIEFTSYDGPGVPAPVGPNTTPFPRRAFYVFG